MKISLAPDPVEPSSVVEIVVAPPLAVALWGREEEKIFECYLIPPQSVIWQVEHHREIGEAVRNYLLGILSN